MTPQEKAQKYIERMDAVVRAAEVKWGLPFRLTQLVPDDLAAKFDRQWQALSVAIMNSHHADVCTLSDGAIRGIWALEKAAMDAGHVPLPLLPIGEPVALSAGHVVTSDIAPLPKAWFMAGGDSLDGM